MPECEYEDCEEPALRNSEHCIFHEPEKTGLAAKGFYKLIRQEAREPEGEIVEDDEGEEHRRWVFEEEADWEGYKFPDIPKVGKGEQTLFNFERCEFTEEVNLFNSTFESKISFNHTEFNKYASFWHATFVKKATFKDAEFYGSAGFKNANFFGRSVFNRAIFARRLNLNGTYFKHRPSFISALLELDKGIVNQIYDIEDTLEVLDNGKLQISQVEIKYIDNSKETYSDRKEARAKLEDLVDKKLSEVRVYVKKFFQPQAKTEGCREQRLNYEARGKKGEADRVFVHEMRARRESKKGLFRQIIDWLVADWTCKYGTSWERVLLRSVQIIGISGLMFWLANVVSRILPASQSWVGTITGPNVDQIMSLEPLGLLRGLGNSLYYSAITFTTLGYGDLHPTGLLMKVMSGTESALGALFAALIIVVFARKWMRS